MALGKKPPPPLRTKDEVRNWLLELVELCEDRRAACDVAFPKDKTTKARQQDRALMRYYMAHGQALGCIALAFRLDQVDEIFYVEMSQRVRNSLLPTNIGTQHLGQIGRRS